MTNEAALRQRIVVVDPMPRSREYLRRAIRGLGHSPLVFTDADELLEASRSIQRCALMCFGVPPNTQDLRRIISMCREMVGRDVPVMFLSTGDDPKSLRDLGRMQRNELLATASSFADVYNSLEGFMIRNGLPLTEDGLAWGAYRFYPACALVKVGGNDVWLNSPEFELALEFFHNVERPLSTEWLKAMVSRASVRGWARWLDSRVDHLRHQLALCASDDWALANARCSGYRLTSVSEKELPSPAFAIERCLHI